MSLKSNLFLFILFCLYFLPQYLSNLCSIFFGIILYSLAGKYPYQLKRVVIGPLTGWMEGLDIFPKSIYIPQYKNFGLLVWIKGRSLLTIKITKRKRDKNNEGLVCLSRLTRWDGFELIIWWGNGQSPYNCSFLWETLRTLHPSDGVSGPWCQRMAQNGSEGRLLALGTFGIGILEDFLETVLGYWHS